MRQKQMLKNGFTLIELLVALAVLSLLITAGVPGMQSLLANMSVSSGGDQLVNTLAYARVEAVSRVNNVSVRSSSGTTDWTSGWTVFVDNNGGCTVDGADEVIRVVSPSTNAGVTVTSTTNATACISFNRLGENGGGTIVGFDVEATHATTKSISVSAIGYTSVD